MNKKGLNMNLFYVTNDYIRFGTTKKDIAIKKIKQAIRRLDYGIKKPIN